MPPLHVATDLTDGAVHVLDDVGAGQRPAQLDRQAEADDRENFINALQDAGRDARGLPLQEPGKVADQLLRFVGVIQLPHLPQRLTDGGM